MATARREAGADATAAQPPPSASVGALGVQVHSSGLPGATRVALGNVDANKSASARVRGGKAGAPHVLNAIGTWRSAGSSKVRGPGKPKAFAASARQASSSLPRYLCMLSKAAVNMSLQGSTSGNEGGNHHTSVASLAIVKGRIQRAARDKGGRLSAEAMRKAQDAAAEVFVLTADAAQKHSNGELAAIPRQVATVLEGDESVSGGGDNVVRIVQRDGGLPLVETLDFVQSVSSDAGGESAAQALASIDHESIAASIPVQPHNATKC